jgi:hypothetical protein
MITEATSQLDQVDVQERIVGDVTWLAITGSWGRVVMADAR